MWLAEKLKDARQMRRRRTLKYFEEHVPKPTQIALCYGLGITLLLLTSLQSIPSPKLAG